MKYHTFKIQLASQVAKTLGERCRIMIQEIPQNNGIKKESMMILRSEGEAVPAINLEPFYKAYQKGDTISELANVFVQEYKKYQIPGQMDMNFFLDYESAREKICYKLINYEKNKERLKQIPHRRLLDLAIVYYYHMEDFQNRSASIAICNRHLEMWEITEQQLYEQAEENTYRLLPGKLSGIMQVIQEISESYDLDIDDYMFPGQNFMYVLTNPQRHFGAICFLYPQVAQDIAEFFSNNFYILPSSIHECIIVPDSGTFDSSELKDLVENVNTQCVAEEEILSDNVYYFDRMQQKFSFAKVIKERTS